METETLLQAVLGGASMRRAPGMAAPYASLCTRLVELCGSDSTLASTLLAFENHPTSTTHQAALEQRLAQLQLRCQLSLTMHRPIRVNGVQAKAPLWSVNLGCNFGLKLRDNSVLCFHPSLP